MAIVPVHPGGSSASGLAGLSAVTLATHDMPASVAFYHSLGFKIRAGGGNARFTTFAVGNDNWLNLTLQPSGISWSWWGRVIFYVANVDAIYAQAVAANLNPVHEPRDAQWGGVTFTSPTLTAMKQASSLRPDHDLLVARTRQAAGEGRWTVIVHYADGNEKDRAMRVMEPAAHTL